MRSNPINWKWWMAGGSFVLSVLIGLSAYTFRKGQPAAHAHETHAVSDRGAMQVLAVHPRNGAMERTTTQPGSIHAYESVQLYAGVSGYLKTQAVDIGDRVKRGDVLVTVDVPELEKQVQRYKAGVDRARAVVIQMKARVASAKADREAARALVPQAEATAKSKAAELRFRERQLLRMRELLALKSVDERLVDEKIEQRDAAREAEISAQEAVNSAKSRLAAADAHVQQAEADVVEADAEVKVTQADLEKGELLVKFATVTAPFDGVVTQRNFFVGDFIRSASEGTHLPLLTVQRTDRMRVVVQIPDRDVPYADPGDPAAVELDALPGQKFQAKISRVSHSEDPSTRLMHIEIDLPNKAGKIRNGMYGRVTIMLDHFEGLAIPVSCLTGKPQEGKGNVFVIRDGHAALVPVTIGGDDGLQVGVLSGLRLEDEVIVHPPTGLADGTPVQVDSAGTLTTATAGH
ncbi:MAG: efflux RND transporter periplasmic adaptor subunit [Gemmataceae bacterium]|nr:efflux RND transporter periplasmic adaptor subunit [Gemmataceae bacterium]